MPDHRWTFSANGASFRLLSAALVLAPVLVTAAPPLRAQPAPGKPLRLVIPFPPGATGDFPARLVQARLSDAMAQPVLVENRTGAGGAIGTEFVARSAPDGHTWLVGGASSFGLATLLNPKLGDDPVRDEAMASSEVREAISPLGLVGAQLPPDAFAELVQSDSARSAKVVRNIKFLPQ